MKIKYIFLSVLTVALCSCTERIELDIEQSSTKYLSVEAVLHNISFYEQTISLKESVGYFCDTMRRDAPGVSGASVTVSCGDEVIEFKEKEGGEAGVYYGPDGYVTEPGNTYHLHIERYDDDGILQKYDATSTMPESAISVDYIDYKRTYDLIDSSYTLGLWATVKDVQCNIACFTITNDQPWPFEKSIGLDSKYYRGAKVEGYPIMNVIPTWTRYYAGELYAKPFEEGDLITLLFLTINDDFYDYYMSYYYSNHASSIPLLASQPANMPCNISGNNVVGFFSTAPAELGMTIVDDPARTEFIFPVGQ